MLSLGLHLDRVKMASLLGVSPNTYSKWEYSDRKPRQVIVLKIKKILRKKRQIQLIPLLDAVLKTNAIRTSLDTSQVFILPGTAAEDLVNPCFVEAWKRADNVVGDWLYDFHKES